MAVARKKLIEVALPLAAINKASGREKSIRRRARIAEASRIGERASLPPSP